MFRRDVQRLRHERDDVGLGDRLIVADRQRRIDVGVGAVRFGHEQVTRHLEHCVEHARAADIAPAELRIDHVLSLSVPIARTGLRPVSPAPQARLATSAELIQR